MLGEKRNKSSTNARSPRRAPAAKLVAASKCTVSVSPTEATLSRLPVSAATKAAIAQASLSAARRGARSNVAHIAPEVAAAYTLRMTRTRVVFRCDQNIMRAMRRGRAGARGGLWRHKCLGLRMPLAVLRAGTRYKVRGPMTAVLWASGVVQGVGLAKTLRGRSAASPENLRT